MIKKQLLTAVTTATLLLSGNVFGACASGNATTPTSDFTINGDGSTVTHNKTGLTWQRCSLGQTWDGSSACSTSSVTTFSWKAALEEAAKPANQGWRLPNVKELTSIVEYNCHSPSVNETVFPNTLGNHYWAASPVAATGNNAWTIRFNYGSVSSNAKNSSYYIRLVRDDSH